MQTAKHRKLPRAWLSVSGILVVTILVSFLIVRWLHRPLYGLPYTDDFRDGRGPGWVAYDGTWQIADGAMQNVSDERGAKLLTGSPYWTDYTVESDLRLDGDSGDAGLMLRVQDPDKGVDAFRGFYIGLRLRDNSLIAGDADYGWTELAPKPLDATLRPFQWYHLKGAVLGCHLWAEASTLKGVSLATLDAEIPSCSERGQIGLRSYASGGSWKSVRVTAIKRQPGGTQH